MIDLLVQLHGADLPQVDTNPDSAALFERYKKKRRATLKQFFLNPMSLKVPLVDPDVFWLAGRRIWLVFWPQGEGCSGWRRYYRRWSWPPSTGPELTNNLSDQVLSSSNLLVMAFVFPLVKLLHELGHAFYHPRLGWAVHELGLMFLVFAPVPYVNASASSSFPSKARRGLVAAAGMLVELFLAALALYVWLPVEPGVVRAIAYNIMVVAISTRWSMEILFCATTDITS